MAIGSRNSNCVWGWLLSRARPYVRRVSEPAAWYHYHKGGLNLRRADPAIHMRFSLRSFLLVLFVLALTGSHLYTSWKLNAARHEILALRNELGFLTIVDSDRLNLIQTPKEGWHTWRIYVPPGARYRLWGAAARIPVTGHPHPGQTELVNVDLPEGEFTLKARVERFSDSPTWPGKGEWRLIVDLSRGGGAQICEQDEEMRNWGNATEGARQCATVRGAKGVEIFGRHESFDLIREHEWKAYGSVPIARTPPNPSYGMLLWIEAQ